MPDVIGNIGTNSFLVISVLVFIAVVLLLESLYLMWNSYRGTDAKKLRQRLQSIAGANDNVAQAQLLKQRTLSEVPILQRMLQGLPKAQGLQSVIYQAGLGWPVSRLLLSSAALGTTGFMLVYMIARQPMLFGLVAFGILAAMPPFYVYRKRSQRLLKLELQLPEAIDLMVRALRSGHAFSSGLQMVGEELPEPIAGEFRIVHDEVNFGVSLQQALMNLSERIPITDLRYFVVAVLIQRESGGNLTEVLGNLSRLIRERLKLLAKVRVLSSEGRLSAWVLVIMPFALAGVMNLVNPGFMSPLWTDPIGIAIIEYMLTLMAFGVLIMRKIIKIRV